MTRRSGFRSLLRTRSTIRPAWTLALGLLLAGPAFSGGSDGDDSNAEETDEPPAEAPAPAPLSTFDEVWDRFTFGGDFRLRGEFSLLEPPASDRERARVRARIKASYKHNDDLEIGLRIITGNPDDRNSPHQTLGSSFTGFRVSLDRIYAKWTPNGGSFFMTAGKFGQGFYTNPVYGELIWDGDVQPEGVLAGYSWKGDGVVQSVGLRGGQYVVVESGSGQDMFSTQAQVDAKFKLCSSWNMNTALGYYSFTGPDPLFSANRGNAENGAGNGYASDFGILHPVLAVAGDVGNRPLKVAVEYWRNHRARNSRDMGYAAGISWGQAKQEGDWRAYYQKVLVEQDSVFSPFSQDDFLRTTNMDGHVLGVQYMASDGVRFHLWGLLSEAEFGSADDEVRIRLDMDVTF